MPSIIVREKKAATGLYWVWCLAFFVFCKPVIGQTTKNFSLPSGITAADYAADIIVIKLKNSSFSPQQRSSFANSSALLDKIQQVAGAKEMKPIFPEKSSGKPTQARLSDSPGSLDNIYKMYLPAGSDLVGTINQLLQIEEVVYAEPYYLMKPLGTHAVHQSGYIPNDPEATPGNGKQDYLAVIKAYDAWQIEKGDASVVIGILDTGVGLGHQDLMGNLHYNLLDPINGIDDDSDGYVDNYLGWDMANSDNDPTADNDQHGTMVTGMATATTDNGKGMAGAGFRSSYMPVKIFRSEDNFFWKGYEAIAYAADQGCKVINLSWGSLYGYSAFGQDIINYAVLEKDVVVVAAAGNSGKHENYYPASYKHVLSVAVSDAKDNKVSQTTYGYFVDLMAPGNSNYTTANGDKYQVSSGSSLSTPLVAGAAALVRAKYPELSALQVMEKLRLCADDIYAVGTNANYPEQLGHGRLNMKKALQPLNSPALRMSSFTYYNDLGAYAFWGDTLRIQMNITNYFKPTSANATVTLSSPSKYVTLMDSVFRIGMVDSLQSVHNNETPFKIYLHQDLPVNEKLVFRLGYEDGTYSDYEYFSINSAPDHITINNGTLQLTVGTNGDIAYTPHELYGGKGMLFQSNPVAKQMGLIIAAGADSVSDNVVIDFGIESRSKDFGALEKSRINATTVADLHFGSVFSDVYATNPLGFRVEQTWLADTSAGNGHFMVTEYRVSHLSADMLADLRVGLFADWNLGDPDANQANWDATYQLGYAYDGNLYTGAALLSAQHPAYYAIDIKDLNGNLSDVGSTFTDEERFTFLSGENSKLQAGVHGSGNDVACLLGASTDSVIQYQTEKYAFAVVAGNSLAELQAAVTAAQEKYATFLARPEISQTANVCRDSIVTIVPEGGTLFRFYRDPYGQELLHQGNTFTTWAVSEDTAVYVANIDHGYESRITRINVQMLEPVAAFSFNAITNRGIIHDTLFLDESGNYTIDLKDESLHASSWEWNFGNGFQSTLQNPTTRYDKPGIYTITLYVESEPGCQDTSVRVLTVVERAPAPQIKDQTVCSGSAITLQAANTNVLQFYADASLKQPIGQGASFTSGGLTSDTVFYVVNAGGEYASVPKMVTVKVVQPELEIDYALDTTNLVTKYGITFRATGDLANVQSLEWYVDESWVGEGDSIQYDFLAQHKAGQSFTIRLDYILSSAGLSCAYSTSRTLVPAATDQPAFAVTHICRNDKAVVSPLEGEVFYFYEDMMLDSLIHKGRTMEISGIQGIHTYYVTCMDGLKESDATEVAVSINRFADFALSTDTLYLSEDDRVTLEAFTLDHSDPAQVSWNWDLGDGQMVTKPVSFTQQFDTAGVYHIRMAAYTAEGCVNTIERQLVVQNVAATNTKLIDAALMVYPNPSLGTITIENPHWLYENLTVYLRSTQGKVLFRQNFIYQATPVTIELSGNDPHALPEGIYLLQIGSRHSDFFRKVMITSPNR